VGSLALTALHHRCDATIRNRKNREVKSILEARNMVEVSRVSTTPSVTVSSDPVAYFVTLSTVAGKDYTFDRPLVDEKTGYPFVGELKTGDESEGWQQFDGVSPRERARE